MHKIDQIQNFSAMKFILALSEFHKNWLNFKTFHLQRTDSTNFKVQKKKFISESKYREATNSRKREDKGAENLFMDRIRDHSMRGRDREGIGWKGGGQNREYG